LEYCSVVWSPHYVGANNRIENLQKNFLKFLNYNGNDSVSYDDLCEKFNISKLSVRRKLSSVLFCYDLLTNRIDSPELLAQINLHCPVRIFRSNEFVRPVRHATNYLKFNPINSMQMNFNTVQELFDFDCVNRNSFKNSALILLSQSSL